MKPQLIIAAIIAFVLPSCMVVTPTSFASMGGDYKNINMKWHKGFSVINANHSKSYTATTKVVGMSIRDWLIAKVISRGLDSQDATTASDEAIEKAKINGSIESQSIASAEKIKLEELAIEAAEGAAPVP